MRTSLPSTDWTRVIDNGRWANGDIFQLLQVINTSVTNRYLVMRLSGQGDVLWASEINSPGFGSGSEDNYSNGSCQPNGHLRFTVGPSTFRLLVELDQEGVLVMAGYFSSITLDAYGDTLRDPLDIHAFATTNDGGSVIASYNPTVLVRSDSEGAVLWAKRFASGPSYKISAIKEVDNQALLIGGFWVEQSHSGQACLRRH